MAHAEEDRKALGRRLAAARKIAGFPSLQSVADRLTELGYPIGKAAVGHWETGTNLPDAIWLRRLAKLYNTTLDALVWDDSISIEAIQVAAEFDGLTDEQKRGFRALWMAFFQQSVDDKNVERKMPITKTEKEPK